MPSSTAKTRASRASNHPALLRRFRHRVPSHCRFDDIPRIVYEPVDDVDDSGSLDAVPERASPIASHSNHDSVTESAPSREVAFARAQVDLAAAMADDEDEDDYDIDDASGVDLRLQQIE